MARPDFLSQIPSLEELLEHPRVASAIDRVNRSTAVVQLRTAIHNLGAEVARRTEGLPTLGAGEIVERLIRQLEFPRTAAASRCINATGELFGLAALKPPVASAAIEAARVAADGFRQTGALVSEPIAAELVGAKGATICSSPYRAVATAVEALAAGGVCVIARGDMTELAPGVRLDEVCRRIGVTLREVGAADAATTDDFGAALAELRSQNPRSIVVLLRRSFFSQESAARLQETVSAAHQAGATVIADLGRLRPRRDTPVYGDTQTSVGEVLGTGADVGVFDAAGLLGAPVAGVIVGRESSINTIRHSLAARLDIVDPAVDAALAATLRLFERPAELRFTHPLHQLLDAPLENLRTRAERLAVRIAAVEGVATAMVVERPSPLRGGPSWGVRIEPAAGTAGELRQRLAAGEPAVWGAEVDSAVILDLATVFPGQDSDLVDALTPDSRSGEPQSAAT